MSYVDPMMREKFESLPINLKDAILERDVKIHSMADLIQCLEEIVEGGS